MNCRLDNVTITGKDGKLSVLEQVYLYLRNYDRYI